MKLNYIHVNSLPPLSWCAHINKGDDNITVFCGNAVARNSTFFAAGVWDGDYISGDFIHCNVRCMTGCKLIDNSAVFTTSSYPQEMMWSIQHKDELIISNSLCFVMAEIGASLDPDYYNYEEAFNSLAYGTKRHFKTIPIILENQRKEISIHVCCTLRINSDLSLISKTIETNINIQSFEDYFEAIIAALDQIKKNAIDENRKISYDLISTISRGYDATAVSALTRRIGCDKVLTFNLPQKYVVDCGTDIAKQLGFKEIHEGDAREVLSNSLYFEAESAAGGDMSLVIFDVFENIYKNSLLFMGIRGDSIWDINSMDRSNSDYDFGNMRIGTPQNPENFLRNNTIIISVPLFFADHWQQIAKISNSPIMKGYSVGGDYDRPIARRIVEQSGINRNSFGIKKKGVGYTCHFDTKNSMKKKMSEKSFRSFCLFCKNHKSTLIPRLRNAIVFYFTEFATYVNYFLAISKIPIRMKRSKNYHSGPYSALLLQWGVDYIINRYKTNK